MPPELPPDAPLGSTPRPRNTTERALSVRIPASTSNLGPGYDVVGLALDLSLSVRALPLDPGEPSRILSRSGEARGWPAGPGLDPRDLFVRALGRAGGSECTQHGWGFEISSQIPLERGLGSSGAATAAGLLLGHAIAHGASPTPAERQQLFALGLELEGHPENVSASLLGGCTLSTHGPAGTPMVADHPVHESLAFALAWPDIPMNTQRARAALPESVPHALAVENGARLAFLLRGLSTGRGDLLAAAEPDQLHVPHRLPLLQGAEQALAAARSNGAWLATLSGSGSALLAIAAHGSAPAVARAMADAFQNTTGAGHAHVATVANEAPEVHWE